MRPLAGRCAAAGRVRKAVRAGEEGLAHCMRRNDPHCPEDANQVCIYDGCLVARAWTLKLQTA